MAITPNSEFRFGHKLTLVLLISCISGFLWAMVEREPWTKIENPPFVSKRKSKKITPPVLPTKKEPPPLPPEPKPDPVQKPEKVADPKPAPSGISSSQVEALFKNVQRRLTRADFDTAADELNQVDEIQIEDQTQRNALRGWKALIKIYQALLNETKLGRTIPMPEMTRINLKNGGKIVARTISSEDTFFSIEDIRGIRSRIEKTNVKRINKLDPSTAFWEIWEKVQSKCRMWGITATEEKQGNQFVFLFDVKTESSVIGEKFFQLADFCISNGANRLVRTLFDEALKRNRNLLTIVHEKKGERLVSLLFYFLSIPAPSDAEYLLQKVLQPHYSDTTAFQQRIQKDPEAVDLLTKVLKKSITITPPTDPPSETPPDPKPAPPRENLPGTTPAKIQKVVLQGDQFYKKGMEHLLK
ncbi:MAG: hypothetical protein QF645_10345, partial [Planctomycetota bacterium]|nr:hypothetical protein [Planctomycetota bacterium]